MLIAPLEAVLIPVMMAMVAWPPNFAHHARSLAPNRCLPARRAEVQPVRSVRAARPRFHLTCPDGRTERTNLSERESIELSPSFLLRRPPAGCLVSYRGPPSTPLHCSREAGRTAVGVDTIGETEKDGGAVVHVERGRRRVLFEEH